MPATASCVAENNSAPLEIALVTPAERPSHTELEPGSAPPPPVAAREPLRSNYEFCALVVFPWSGPPSGPRLRLHFQAEKDVPIFLKIGDDSSQTMFVMRQRDDHLVYVNTQHF